MYLEAEDIGAAMGGRATSRDPFDSWFREHLLEVHGLDLADGSPPPDQMLDFRRRSAGHRPDRPDAGAPL